MKPACSDSKGFGVAFQLSAVVESETKFNCKSFENEETMVVVKFVEVLQRCVDLYVMRYLRQVTK